MSDNDVSDHVSLLNGAKPICCKWIFKTKKDLKDNMERYKACLVTNWFMQKVDIDYKETFSTYSLKYSFRTTMALVVHFDLELH